MENQDPNIEQNLIFESEEEKLLRGHEYDGIQELNNNPPPWLLWIFYISVVFAAVYLVYYHILGGDTQEERYEKQMAKAQEQIDEYLAQNPVEEIDLSTLTLDETLAKTVFDANCKLCHGEFMQGLIGPNLTDDYWVSGGSADDIRKIINDGKIEKGMQSWKGLLSPVEIEQMVLYIQSKKGSNPENPKAPEGELYQE